MVTISRLLIVTIIMLITIYCIVRVKVMMMVTPILVTIYIIAIIMMVKYTGLVTILRMQERGAVAPVLNKVIVDSTHDRATHCPHCVPGISVPLMMLMFLLPPSLG